jgi:MFS family permease
VSSVAAPAIEQAFGTTHAAFAALVFVGPGVVALVIEPLIFLAADRYPRAWFIRGGLTALAAGSIAAGLAPGPYAMAAAISVCWIAIGSASSLAQATLIDRAPDQRARTMARWTLLALVGDLCTPAVLAGLGVFGLGWRAAYVVVGALIGVWAIVAWWMPIDAPSAADDDEPKPSLLASLREALRDRTLIAWLFGLALCDLLDEILVVFATIHVRDALGGGQLAQSAVVAALLASGAIGLVALDRLLARHGETRLLVAFSAACACAVAAWICAPNVGASIVLAIPVGATSTPLYPLVAARTYAQRPEESGAVLAASHLFTPLGLALPYAVGAIADHWGTYAALTVLIAQPLGLLVLVRASRPSGPAVPATPSA